MMLAMLLMLMGLMTESAAPLVEAPFGTMQIVPPKLRSRRSPPQAQQLQTLNSASQVIQPRARVSGIPSRRFE